MDLIFIFVAYAAGLAVKMIKLPTLVGYLLAGFTVDDVLKQIGDLGVMFLLFTVCVS